MKQRAGLSKLNNQISRNTDCTCEGRETRGKVDAQAGIPDHRRCTKLFIPNLADRAEDADPKPLVQISILQ